MIEPNEAYKRIREHFSAPGAELAVGWDEEASEDACFYRYNGDPTSPIRCAAGVLIPDDKYSPSLEGHGIRFIAEEVGLELTAEAMEFVVTAQRLHDDTAMNAMAEGWEPDPSHFVELLDATWKRGWPS
jgi:hypothetical protein